jgi:hypothetical protein
MTAAYQGTYRRNGKIILADSRSLSAMADAKREQARKRKNRSRTAKKRRAWL